MCFNNGNNDCSCLWLIIIVILICCCCGGSWGRQQLRQQLRLWLWEQLRLRRQLRLFQLLLTAGKMGRGTRPIFACFSRTGTPAAAGSCAKPPDGCPLPILADRRPRSPPRSSRTGRATWRALSRH